MVRYAREDTHYLLYICDRLHNELIKSGNANSNLLQSVYARSKDVCLKRYEKPLFTSVSYQKVLEKHKRTFNTEQTCAFRLLYAWRDNIAREEDESTGFVLPNHMMFQIAETMPREAQGILACCNPVPTLVKQYVPEIHMLIMQAKELALAANKSSLSVGATLQFDSGNPTKHSTSTSTILSQPPLIDPDTKSNHSLVNGDSLLISAAVPSSFGCVIASGPPVPRAIPAISLFEISEDEELTDGQKKAEKIKASFENPFQKFLPVKSDSETTESTATVEELQSHAEVHRINQQWRQATQLNTSPSASEPNAGLKRHHSDSEETPEDATPLRNRTGTSASKKRKTSPGTSKNGGDEEESSTQPGRAFVPFNYSDVDYSTFTGDAEKKTEDKTVVFNPYSSSRDSKSAGPRSKVHMKSGQKSITFSSNKQSSQKKKWPRR